MGGLADEIVDLYLDGHTVEEISEMVGEDPDVILDLVVGLEDDLK